MLASLLPESVVVATATDEGPSPELYPDEALDIRRAREKRRLEFATGRGCARAALRQLGIADFPVRVGTRRQPVWPSGIVGSITHCQGFCAVAVVYRGSVVGLGIDAELHGPLSEDVVTAICTPPETEWLSTFSDDPAGSWSKIIFSAKESIYKCLFPILGVELDFQDVSIQIDPPSGRFSITNIAQCGLELLNSSRFDGRFATSGSRVFTSAVLFDPRRPNVATR